MLFETICIRDGVLQNISYHQERVDRTRAELNLGGDSIALASIIEVPKEFKVGMVRCRVDYASAVERVRFSLYQRKDVRSVTLVEASVDYKFKWSDRAIFEGLLKSNANFDEVIITRNGYLTDATMANIALRQNGEWFTPDAPLLKGTTRALLLDKGMIVECPIHRDSVGEYDSIVLINAMRQFDVSDALPVSMINRA